ncbi:hypothetical protein [Microvirga rosea]|uniref:hypothetical protein n=1 Tax=Microvirga rosea TaxID=2715425 RepID=UPI001D0AA9E8|nr:hypothetical protein [Microvirga rosea]MCB8823159.1 hypothetical protein [Microvirga rosea]
MQVSTRINDQDFTFSIWKGTIQLVLAARRPKTVGAADLLLQSADGERRSILIKPKIEMTKGDKISLVYAQPAGQGNGVLGGLINHETQDFCSMPQGVIPIRLTPTVLMSVMTEARRLTLPATGLVLVALAAACLNLFGNGLPMLTWMLILGIVLALLWAFNELAQWQQELMEGRVRQHTDTFLENLALMNARTNNHTAGDHHGATWILMGDLWTPAFDADWGGPQERERPNDLGRLYQGY